MLMDRRRFERFIVALAAVVCLLFTATLRDLSVSSLWLPQGTAPKLPAGVGERDASLTVTVVDDEGAPVPGALLRVFSVVGERVYLAGTQTAGDDGVVAFTALPRGETWIIADRQGRARSSIRVVLGDADPAAEGQPPEGQAVRLTLHPAESFEVVVVDPFQRPIRGVTVRLFSSDPLVYQDHTDGRGLARFEGLGPPPYSIEVEAVGFDEVFIDTVGLTDSPLFVKLERLGGLTVAVRDPAGEPAKGAVVLVTGSALWPARSATTGEDGTVNINGLPRGFYDLRAERGNLVSDALAGVLLERGESKSVELQLVEGRWITAKVTDGEGDGAPPVENADVALVEGGLSSFPLYGRTGKDGKVRLGPIAGPDATVSARADGFVARSAVTVEEGQDEVQIPLIKGAKITGVVVDEDDYPIDGAELEVVGIDVFGMPIAESSSVRGFAEDHFAFALPGATPLVPAGELGVMPIVPDIPRDVGPLTVSRSERTAAPWVSRSNGEMVLEPVTPGRVRVVARHPDYTEGISAPVDLVPGGEAEVKVVLRKGGILEGRVVEEDDTPVAGARIEVLSPFSSLERVTYTADDGSFAFAALPERVILHLSRATALDHVVATEVFDVPRGDRREVEIVLPEPRDPITLRVVDDRGYPIERVEIRTTSLDPDTALIRTAFSDEEGEATILDARGLPLRFFARRRGYGPTVAEIEPVPKTVELVLPPAVAAQGMVESRYGPIADAEVTLLTPTGKRGARADEEGKFRIEDLAPGWARLLVIAEGHVPDERDVEIISEGGRDADLGRIELSEGGAIEGVVLDEEGEPIVGARVAVGRVPTYLPLGPLPPGVAATDRDGKFRLADAPEGAQVVEAYKVGYGRAAAEVEVRARDTTAEVTLEMIEDPDVDLTRVDSRGSLGVTLGEDQIGGRQVIVFEHVPLGGEAQRAAILAGDRFLAYNGVPIRSLEQARSRLNGPLGQDFVLTLGRDADLRWRVRVSREKLRR